MRKNAWICLARDGENELDRQKMVAFGMIGLSRDYSSSPGSGMMVDLDVIGMILRSFEKHHAYKAGAEITGLDGIMALDEALMDKLCPSPTVVTTQNNHQ